MHKIELIQREGGPPYVARVFDYAVRNDQLLFCSAAYADRQLAIAEAQGWALRKFGNELPVCVTAEILPYLDDERTEDPPPRDARRARDRAYGKPGGFPPDSFGDFD